MAKAVVETHPFEAFVPKNIKCLIVGSFPGKDQTGRNWMKLHGFTERQEINSGKSLKLFTKRELKNRKQKQQLFEEAGIGMADVIKSCIRKEGTNLDENLEIKEYNKEAIEKILKRHQPKVLFTSRFVEREFKKLFPDHKNIDILLSPSPRYFKLTMQDKAKIYKEKLPKIK